MSEKIDIIIVRNTDRRDCEFNSSEIREQKANESIHCQFSI